MIFKTLDSDINKWTSKIGILGKSFDTIFEAKNQKKIDVDDLVQYQGMPLNKAKKQVGSLWSYLFPQKENIQNQLINVDKLIPKIDISNTTEITEKIKKMSESVAKGEITWQKLFDTLPDAEKHFAQLGRQLEGQIITTENVTKANQQARASALAHNEAIKAQTFSAKAGQAALKGLAIAGNMILFAAISKGIELAVKGIDDLAHSAEHCKERVGELMSDYQSALDKAHSKAKTIEDLASRYEELSNGVNNLGENISLTADEYEEYNSIVNNIAEMFPTMVQGYTDENNAILKLKGNVDALRDAYEAEAQAAYNSLITTGKDADGNDILKDANNVIKGSTFGSHDWGNVEKINYLDKLIESTNSVDDMLNLWNESFNSSYSDWFSDFAGVSGTVNIGKLTDDDLADIKRNAKILKQQYQAEINSVVDNAETLANAYLMTNEDYDKLDEQSKNAASIMVNSLNANIVSQFGKNKENVGKYVDGIIQIISSNPDAKDAMIGLFTMDTADMPVDDIAYKTTEYINNIAEILGEDPAELRVRLGFNDNTTEPLKSKVQGLLKDEFDSKVGELTLDELQIAATQIEVSENNLLSWDELIAKINEIKILSAASSPALSISQTITQLNTRLKPALDSLQSIYQNIFADDKFDLNNIDFLSACDSVKSKLDEMSEAGLNVDYSSYEKFVRVLQDSESTPQTVKDAFDSLASSITSAALSGTEDFGTMKGGAGNPWCG